MMFVLMIGLAVVGAYLTAYVAYQVLLFAANALLRNPKEFEPSRYRRFNVFVPAHNEELYLPRLLASLQSQQYPSAQYRVTVIADNCSDGTAAASRPFGVDVLERNDPERRGKGYAIGWTLEQLDLSATDAIVIVDGDSIADPRLLQQLNLQLERGDQVIQCYNGVANPGQSWFTALMNVSRTIANEIIHPGKRKLGLSSHLMGNGMCFDVGLLRSFGWNAFSVGEDWEYYVRLVTSGAHVGYSRQSRVYHQESVDLQQASSQRLRWSGSRFQVLRQHVPALVAAGLKRGDVKCLDAALPLLFPNPSLGINLTVVGVILAAASMLLGGGAGILLWYSTLAVLQLAMFLVGVMYTENKTASALSLFLAPAFLAWKLCIDVASFGGAGSKQWKPTARRLS
jgi:cellulose synthase/poly-beta-1,6-N-acetylglucosamine synthase-like glycosyltransferase